MKHIKYIIAIPLMCLFACSDELEEINENPNSPTNVPIERMFLGLERDLSTDYAINSFDVTNKFVNYTEFPNRLWDAFLVERVAEEDWWSTHFRELTNMDYVLENAGDGEEDYRGVALVMKSWMYYLLTSFYGDVPYSQAGKAAQGINQPAYDTQENVFKGIIADLEEANNLLGSGSVPLSSDFLLDNDATKWKKFANSLKVRVLIAQSGQVDPSVELQKMLDDPAAYPMMGSNADQPAFNYNDEEPYPRNSSGLFFTDETYMADDFINKLVQLGDERIKMFAAKTVNTTPNGYAGIPSGVATSPSADNVSKISNLIFDSKTIHAIQVVWMGYAELQFLLAEAAEKNWISGGTAAAQEYYEKGIEASYNYQKSRLDIGIEQGAGLNAMSGWNGSYLQNTGVAYTGNSAEKQELIAIQKWISLYTDMESYFSWKRTKLPVLTFNPAGPNAGVNPMRFRYPLDERLFNKENYEQAVSVQGSDEWDTRIWMLK